METLKVQKDGKYYMLFNLEIAKVRELQKNPQSLSEYFNYCLGAQSNICVLENEHCDSPDTTNRIINSNTPSSALNAPSTSASVNIPLTTASANTNCRKIREFDFRCGTFENQNYIYGLKFDDHPWHYFDLIDSISAEHGSLPASVDVSIGRLDGIGTVKVHLNEDQSRNYFKNGKFVFKNKELQTYMEIDSQQLSAGKSKSPDKSSKRLIFISGQTNPLLFVHDFENCSDVKSDKDKMYKILNFVDDCHKGEFTQLYFTSDWETVKSKFFKCYTKQFVQNKKKELNIDFNGSITLRSFVELKLEALSRFTTLPFFNQIEMVMNDLPVGICSLFISKEKMTCKKTEILNFCDSIQDLVENMLEMSEENPNRGDQESKQASDKMDMEIFSFIPENSTEKSRGRGRGRGSVRVKVGRITKKARPSKLNSILECTESSDSYGFLEEIDESSRSSWSEGI